jgi:peptidoglycan/xylan/chitin deacetylase (PgdA/CDA1 family)
MKQKVISALFSLSGTHSFVNRILPWCGVLVLNYHRIGDGSASLFDHGLWSADVRSFNEQVGYLKSNFDVIGTDDLPGVLARKSGRQVLITFDDGYRDNYTAAFPILKRHGVPASFFISTGFLDRPGLPWWDEIAWMVRSSRRDRVDVCPWLPEPVPFDTPHREGTVRILLRTFKAMPSNCTQQFLSAIGEATGSGRFDPSSAKDLWMTWDMIREMRAAGMSIGGHTVTHPILAQASPEQQWQEISGCGERLHAELGAPMRAFSYPVGSRTAFNDETRAYLRRAGVQYAFSYYGGFRRFTDWDDYDIRRVPIEPYISKHWFRAIATLPRFFSPMR